MRTETMIAVRDVEASSRFYQRLLGVRSTHGGKEFDRLEDEDGVVLLLHHWGAPEHPSMLDAGAGPIGHGVELYFRVENLDAYHRRATTIGVAVDKGPWYDPLAHQREFSVRDPDGYRLTLCE
jgi:catechol 2,3-dioxygenase-like lactoylglutathione lyase family enzyme